YAHAIRLTTRTNNTFTRLTSRSPSRVAAEQQIRQTRIRNPESMPDEGPVADSRRIPRAPPHCLRRRHRYLPPRFPRVYHSNEPTTRIKSREQRRRHFSQAPPNVDNVEFALLGERLL